jgi:hypothetical protein
MLPYAMHHRPLGDTSMLLCRGIFAYLNIREVIHLALMALRSHKGTPQLQCTVFHKHISHTTTSTIAVATACQTAHPLFNMPASLAHAM